LSEDDDGPELRAALAEGAALGAGFRLALGARQRGGRAGARLGLGLGSSLEFEEYREYQPGDDLRQLDWGVYARTDRLVLRTQREEVSPRLDLLVDVSRSMGASAAKPPGTWKLAAALATAAAAGGLDVLAWRLGVESMPLAPAGALPHVWHPLALDAACGPERSLLGGLPLRNGGARLLLSDLLFPADPEALLRPLVAGGSAVAVVRLASEEETARAAGGEVRLRDAESGERLDLVLDAETRAAFARARQTHLGRWAAACRRHGVDLAEVSAESLAGAAPAGALGALLTAGILAARPAG
jgi:uncharacterized protein (DUF58 family)